MALLEKQLYVKRSTLSGAGKGLFTKKLIPKDTRIVEYKGKLVRWKDVKDDDENGYLYYINRNHVINAWPALKALARYANDAKGIIRAKGIGNNCVYMSEGLHAYIESVKVIPAGSEIFVDYGKEYWDVKRKNIRRNKVDKRIG